MGETDYESHHNNPIGQFCSAIITAGWAVAFGIFYRDLQNLHIMSPPEGCWAYETNGVWFVSNVDLNVANQTSVGGQMRIWFLVGCVLFASLAGLSCLRCVNGSSIKMDCINMLLACPQCLTGLCLLVWYVWGFFIRFDQAGQACVTVKNGMDIALLPKSGKMFNWFYGITLGTFAFMCVCGCISMCCCRHKLQR